MRRVLITGAGRGLGLELSRQCLQRGDRVFAAVRLSGSSDGLGRLRADYPETLTVVPLDVTDPASLETARRSVEEQVDALDLLVNNAGIGHTSRDAGDRRAHTSLGKLDADKMLQVFRVNAIAPVMVTQLFHPLLGRGTHPVVIQITSALGSLSAWSPGGSYSYDASKTALNMLNLHLAEDLRDEGIVAVVIHPGWVRTDMGGSNAPLSAEDSVQGILEVVDGLTIEDAGRFLQWNGTEHPW